MKHIILVTLLSWLVFSLKAQQPNEPKQVQKFSLQDAVSYARKYNFTLKNNSLEVTAAEKKVKEILASGLPNVNASGSFTNYLTVPSAAIDFGGVTQVIKFGVPNNATASITANQLLFDGGFLMGVKASKEYVNLSRINLQRSGVEVEVSVSKTYYSVLLIKTNLDLIAANLETLAKTKNDLEKLSQNGLIDKTEYDRIALQYSSLQLQRDRLMDQHKSVLMVLKLQMGLNVHDEIELTDDLTKLYAATKTAVVPAKAEYNNRLEYQSLNQAIRLYELDKKRYMFGYAPSLVGFFTHQENSFGQDFNALGKTWYSGTFWGLSLSVPVFDGLKKSAQIQQARINIYKAENDKKSLENAIDMELFNAKTAYERAAQQLDIQQKDMKLAEEIYNRTQVKYQNGVGSSLELTTAQNSLESARAAYLTTLYNYFVAQIDVRKATGEIK